MLVSTEQPRACVEEYSMTLRRRDRVSSLLWIRSARVSTATIKAPGGWSIDVLKADSELASAVEVPTAGGPTVCGDWQGSSPWSRPLSLLGRLLVVKSA